MTHHDDGDLVLSSYPLTVEYRRRLQQAGVNPSTFLTLNQLRLLHPFKVVAALRAQKTRNCVIALEDEGSGAALPVLRLLAAFATARAIQLVHPDFRAEYVGRGRALLDAVGILAATVDGFRAERSYRRGIEELAREVRLPGDMGSRRPALLYLNANLWFGLRAGGAVAHMTGVVNALSDRGYEVDFASVVPIPGSREQVRSHALSPLAHLGLPEERNYFRFQRHVLGELRALAGKGNHAFIYQRMSVHNYVGVPLSRETRLPLVLEYNGSEAWAAENWGRPLRYRTLAVEAEQICLRHAHLVVTVSEALRQDVIERGVEPGRVVTYPNGFDPRLFDPARFNKADVADCRGKIGIPSDAIVATFVGTFGKWHGVDILARVIRRLVDEAPEWLRTQRLRFLLIGDGGRMGIVREILGNSCSEFVSVQGLVPPDAVPLYLASSDILLAPHVPNDDGSEFFGSPTKLFEYMAMGKAIVASDLGQIGQVLSPSLSARELHPQGNLPDRHDYVAVLVQPANEQELAHAIRVVAANQPLRERLGASARTRAIETHTWGRHVDEILKAVGKLEQVRIPASESAGRDASGPAIE